MMNARRITLDNGRTLITFRERSHTDECSGDHDEVSGACIAKFCGDCGEAHDDWECPDHVCFDCVHKGAR